MTHKHRIKKWFYFLRFTTQYINEKLLGYLLKVFLVYKQAYVNYMQISFRVNIFGLGLLFLLTHILAGGNKIYYLNIFFGNNILLKIIHVNGEIFLYIVVKKLK